MANRGALQVLNAACLSYVIGRRGGMGPPFALVRWLRRSFGIIFGTPYFSQLLAVLESEASQLSYKETACIRSDEGKIIICQAAVPAGQKLPSVLSDARNIRQRHFSYLLVCTV